MKTKKGRMILTLILATARPAFAELPTVDILLAEYRSQGATAFRVETGALFWTREFTSSAGKNRQCTSCHLNDTRQSGKHFRTGKTIQPIAPSVNAARLVDPKKIEKWFLRNCKWTLGRSCTAQEKGDLLTYLRTQ